MHPASFTPDFLSRLECLRLRTRREVLGDRRDERGVEQSQERRGGRAVRSLVTRFLENEEKVSVCDNMIPERGHR